MFSHANFEIVHAETTDRCLVIRDLGPWSEYKTVTNAAEEVVRRLVRDQLLKPGQRLEYYDSASQRDQILVENGEFAGFAPAAN